MKIFISIASYQDPLLVETLCSAYTNAKYKENLVFGVCEQSRNGIDLDSLVFKKQVRYELVDPVMSKGACWARSRVQHFFKNEDFFLQIDSHTIFTNDWDHILLKNYFWIKESLQENFVITGYPRAFKPNEDLTSFELDTSSKITWGIALQEEKLFEDGHYSGQRSYPSEVSLPLKGYLIAAGFIFSKGHFVKKFPYDSKFYFHGEELSIALRLFTNNWAVTYIPEAPLFHFYTDINNLKRKLHWDKEDEEHRVEKWTQLDKKSKSRLSDLVTNQLNEPYGLGELRSLEEFGEKSGIDLINKKILDIKLATQALSFEKINSSSEPYNEIYSEIKKE